MGSQLSADAPHGMEPTAYPFREILDDAIGYWEQRRIAYNLFLASVVVARLVTTWPHSRPIMDLHSLLLLSILAAAANILYCAAYSVDISLQYSSSQTLWISKRWVLWLARTLFATLVACCWIVDEIYPFVG